MAQTTIRTGSDGFAGVRMIFRPEIKKIGVKPTGRLLPGVLVALLMAGPGFAGCVVPSDIHERSDSISAPSLDRSLITPSPDRVVELTYEKTEFSVAAAVTNVDIDQDTLYFQWFVGYPESASPLPPLFESQMTVDFYPCHYFDILAPVNSIHTIELFISEEPVEFDPTTGRTVPDSYIYVSWPVRLKDDCL